MFTIFSKNNRLLPENKRSNNMFLIELFIAKFSKQPDQIKPSTNGFSVKLHADLKIVRKIGKSPQKTERVTFLIDASTHESTRLVLISIFPTGANLHSAKFAVLNETHTYVFLAYLHVCK